MAKQKSNCPYSRECGGCQFIDVPYEKQLEDKLAYMRGLLEPYCEVESIEGMKNPYNYRNKIHATFGRDKGRKLVSGRYAEGTRRLVTVNKCRIENERADEIILTIRDLAEAFKIQPFDPKTKKGLLRHVLVRVARHTRQILVVLVTGTPAFPSRKNFIKALLEECPDITTIVQNVNGKDTGMILGDKEEVVFGQGYIEDILCKKSFRISSKSFYQVNSAQTEVLYSKAIEFAQLTGSETVIDAYCGIGTIGICAADKCGEVIGCELNKDAVKDALANKKLNGLKGIRFECADAGQFMTAMAAEGKKADVVFMDPPRSGSSKEFLQALCTLKPRRVVYISCGPESLARDLKYLTANGYKAEKAICVDMFPHTGHTEAVVALSLME
ncbi:MAG: 23S rRNA (uracil(1939)-C(5))-methyltransferase RlmD [Clostridia bacterium]|nr:23S rRNA (uracil(1939)-C(5))-methyltransferase RlmD [Clostridia bacterium]